MRPSRKSSLQQEMRENFAHFSRSGATTSHPPELGNSGHSSQPAAPQTHPWSLLDPKKDPAHIRIPASSLFAGRLAIPPFVVRQSGLRYGPRPG
ncbi:Piso0_000236 [Millerozyma farinosa CBS 7064]|uniref:Piso0_000236 protein n=1 Tax=Pichia sorbitophila (strain ATCC MYA-4447 / BCRC 22081 / CBS 7064 / NBRC 10061 / NRRL Y-12695) TaxID=559304 RepID=G8YUW4_PICSO|nr:Piso0_000236 [Millerozyma farinosa CBS 7064]